MKINSGFLFVLCLGIITFSEALLYKAKWGQKQNNYPAQWFEQRLDHFNPLDTRTFKQRYYENFDHWNEPSGPIFLNIGGEGPMNGPPSDDGSEIVQLAKKLGALILSVEHRYYGLSVPFEEITTENLQFLSSRQALNDLAIFISWYSARLGTGNQWFTFGGSYSGALSAWFRLKYPHLTSGSLSSSGVVNAVLDFTAFDEQVAQSVGPDCASQLRKATLIVEKLIDAGGESKKKTKALFGAESLEDDGDFFYMLADCFAESVQYDFQHELCNAFVNQSDDDLLAIYANYTQTFFYTHLGSAADYSTAEQKKVKWTEDTNYRQWWFQKCTEVAYFQNAPKVGSIRSKHVNMDYHRRHCKAVFEKDLWPDTNGTNAYYGGDHIAASNIFFSNGSQDPWKHASVTSSLSDSEPALVVTCGNCGHCVDLRGCPNGCDDPVALQKARSVIASYVSKWLNAN